MEKTVAILMAVYNGETFLKKQLDSIAAQTFKNWRLFVIDDGSTDASFEILQDYQKQWGDNKLIITKLPNQGCTRAFLSLACDPAIQADYYAYSDQDDVWDPDKLARALTILEKFDPSIPQLYGARARLSDEDDKIIGELPLKRKALSFSHALVQCFTTGNTMVFNEAAHQILMEVGPMDCLGNHDWWTGLAISACGGICYYDEKPTISYRQHTKNILGFVDSYYKRYKKALKRVLRDDFIRINDVHIEKLHKIYSRLTPSSKKTLEYFEKSRQGNIFKRMFYLQRAGVYRQDLSGTFSVYLAQAMRKL